MVEAKTEHKRLASLLLDPNGLASNVELPIPDWKEEEWLTQLDHHGLSCLVKCTPPLPQKTHNALKAKQHLAVANEALKQPEVDQLLRALRDKGVDALIIKGYALAYSLYEQPWRRPRTDLDLLVKEDQVKLAQTLLVNLGYSQQLAVSGDFVTYQSTHGKQLSDNAYLNIDLHWRISNRQILAKTLSFSEIERDAKNVSALSTAAFIPSNAHSLLIACIHRAGHHNKDERLAWLYDIHLLCNTLSSESCSQLSELAKQKQISAIVDDALQTTSALYGTNIKSFNISQHSAARSKEPSAIFLDRDITEWRYFFADLKALPTISNRLKLIRETVLPNSAYVKQRMNTRYALIGYFKRAIKGLQRVIH